MKRTNIVLDDKLLEECVKEGITIRKPLDCMIASVAIENDISLLHNNKDF